jgi:hypothetical protein
MYIISLNMYIRRPLLTARGSASEWTRSSALILTFVLPKACHFENSLRSGHALACHCMSGSQGSLFGRKAFGRRRAFLRRGLGKQ